MRRAIISALSAERFRTYLTGAGHDPERALDLYKWNAEIGSAFHMPIQALEVALRNGMNRALVAQFGENWWRNENFLRLLPDNRLQDLRVVQMRIRKRRLRMITGQFVAGLSFGFWAGLLKPEFNPGLWSRHLHSSFPISRRISTERSSAKKCWRF